MIKCYKWPIGICSWCAGDDIDTLDRLKANVGLDHIHLNITPALKEKTFATDFVDHDWKISCTMIGFDQEDYSAIETIKNTGGIVPDGSWENNCRRVLDAINITSELRVKYLSFHAGFIESDIEKMLNRMKYLADAADEKGVILLMETGQESAGTLRNFLEQLNHPAIGINFDPANMVLYNMGDPIEAVRLLGTWIKHVHIKDAIRSEISSQWGPEVPWGQGQVGGEGYLKVLKETGFAGVMAIEREVGNNKIEDVKLAVERLRKFVG